MNSIEIDDALLLQSTQRYESELLILDSISTSWDWEPKSLSGGILIQHVHDNEGDVNVEGDTLLLSINVMLVNGNHCFSQDSLPLIVGHFDGPKMFDEISRNISQGDSIRALVPSNMGFALRGIPGIVPPGAMILVEIKQLAY